MTMMQTPLLDTLNGIRRKVKWLGLAYGAGMVLITIVGILLGLVLLDYLLDLSSWQRLTLMVVAVGGIGYSLNRWIVRPFLVRLTLSDVAGRLEHAFPQFDDRLRSTVDFLSGQIPGSNVMQEHVIAEASELAREVDLKQAIVTRPVWYSLGTSLAALLLVAGVLRVTPEYSHVAFSRLSHPFEGHAWPRRVQIEMVGDVPPRVPVGQRVAVRMKLTRGDRVSRRAIISYQYDNGPLHQEYMSRNDDGTYAAFLDARIANGEPLAVDSRGQLKVWVKSGDDEKIIGPITVVPRLAINQVQAIITPPKYAQQSVATYNLAIAPAAMVAGSRVAIRIGFNKQLASDVPVILESLTPDSQAKDAAPAWDRSVAGVATGQWVARQSLRFHIRATDVDGFGNSALEEYQLVVRPDQNPTVQIEYPRRNEERTPVAVVPLQGIAEDDFGIKSLALVVDRIARGSPSNVSAGAMAEKNHWEIGLVGNGVPASGIAWNKIDGTTLRQRFRLNYSWELGQLGAADLRPGDVLEYHLRVRDNYDMDGETHQAVASGKLRISLISQEELANRIFDELRTIANQLTDVRNSQNRTRQETVGIAKETQAKSRFDATDRAVAERLANQQGMAASQAKQLAGKLENIQDRLGENRSANVELKEITKDVKNQLDHVAENPMKEAGKEISAAAQPDSPTAARNGALQKAVDHQQQASDQLQKALDRLGNIGSLQQTIDRIRDILAEQRRISKETADIGKNNLGKTPEQMSREDAEKLDKNAREQDALANRTGKAIEEMGKMAGQLAKSDSASADAMKQAAQMGQQQGVSSNQSAAAQHAQKNQQSQAQSSQKKAELGLEMMLNELRQAERRKLEELTRQLEEMQQQIANLIRRQAGHNLDNLSLQGPDRINNLDTKLLGDLLTKSDRLRDHLPPVPELPSLTSSQEQTERNTRDIAQAVEAMVNGSEASAELTRAGGKMERAIASLRDRKLSAAYDPSQVEALAALVEAKRLVDQQQARAQKQLQQKQKDAIRDVYVKVRDEQEKLNKETVWIDGSPKNGDGGLKREEVIRLGQLPAQQGELSDRVSKLEEDLASLGSIVYLWANRDIAGSMNQVKDDLSKRVMGIATQAEQGRIIEQLDAMIKNLSVKPPEERFAERGGGGGGGGSSAGPKLPSEVELRLLKELQGAVNKSTRIQNEQPEKDKPKLFALGGRQGELRSLLDQLLQKASKGQVKLRSEPDNRDQLPEEAGTEKIEDQELEQELLNQEPAADKVEKDVNLIGDRMARSRQRLAINSDPGKTTQAIQDRILKNLDDLIDMARKQQSTASSQSQSRPGEAKIPPKANPNPANAQARPNTGSQTPAQSSTLSPGANSNADLSQDIKQTMKEWGGITQRQRQAVIEGAGETVIEKYKKLVDDYYRSLATKATERQQ